MAKLKMVASTFASRRRWPSARASALVWTAHRPWHHLERAGGLQRGGNVPLIPEIHLLVFLMQVFPAVRHGEYTDSNLVHTDILLLRIKSSASLAMASISASSAPPLRSRNTLMSWPTWPPGLTKGSITMPPS